MVTEDIHATVLAENAQLREQVVELSRQLAAALQRIAELEAKKTPPPNFVKANVPERTLPKPSRAQRASEHNYARRRAAEPTTIVEHPVSDCPD